MERKLSQRKKLNLKVGKNKMARRLKESDSITWGGFIVHPNWTGGGKYSASYGKNKNKTERGFNTLQQAKTYLRMKGVKGGIYKTSTGSIKQFFTKTQSTRKPTGYRWSI